jgi:hypothetical protein
MMFDIDRFIESHPQLYHMTHLNAWDPIRRHGLLSTKLLLDRLQLSEADKEVLYQLRKGNSQTRNHPDFGEATIRDQSVMPHVRLGKVLTPDTSLSDWLDLLNSRVFLWAKENSLLGLLKAKKYRDQVHTVLIFDTRKVFKKYRGRIEASDINSGAVLFPNAPERGKGTFQPISAFTPKRGRGLVEITIPEKIDNVEELLAGLEQRSSTSTHTYRIST